MGTIKINLEKGQTYIGVKGLGQVQKDLSEVVDKIISGKIIIKPQDIMTNESITFRCDDVEIELLHKIAVANNISLQKLLRVAMESENLIGSIDDNR